MFTLNLHTAVINIDMAELHIGVNVNYTDSNMTILLDYPLSYNYYTQLS
jgi:hypothetical protein